MSLTCWSALKLALDNVEKSQNFCEIISLSQKRYVEKLIVKIPLRSLCFLHWYQSIYKLFSIAVSSLLILDIFPPFSPNSFSISITCLFYFPIVLNHLLISPLQCTPSFYLPFVKVIIGWWLVKIVYCCSNLLRVIAINHVFQWN